MAVSLTEHLRKADADKAFKELDQAAKHEKMGEFFRRWWREAARPVSK